MNGKKWSDTRYTNLADFIEKVEHPLLASLGQNKDKFGIIIERFSRQSDSIDVLFIDKDISLNNSIFDEYYKNGNFLYLVKKPKGEKKFKKIDNQPKVLDILKNGQHFECGFGPSWNKNDTDLSGNESNFRLKEPHDNTIPPKSLDDKDKKKFPGRKNSSSTVKKNTLIGVGFILLISVVGVVLYFFKKYEKTSKKVKKVKRKKPPTSSRRK